MTAGEIKRLSITPQTTYHPATFKGAGNQGSQFCRIDIGTDFASSLPILGNRLHPIKPRTESLAGFRPQLWIAIVGIDGRIQQRAASRHQPGAPVPKVPHDLFEAINRIRNLLCAFEASNPSAVAAITVRRSSETAQPAEQTALRIYAALHTMSAFGVLN
jgi:hypothetical protein